MDAEWVWNRCNDRLNIFLAACIELVIMTIFDIPIELVAWFIPYLMAKSLASVLLTLTVWWSVLTTGLLQI